MYWISRKESESFRRARLERKGDINDKTRWPDVFDWYIEQAERLYDAFYPVLKEIEEK
ncbi:MAG: DUF4268 domain-containing protein [Candidatus Lokiarchaeota archaeon]|nr:DUF4268 domain-containing protein [Candidatus Lokiarchaeota archaeon]